jgi:two-component system, cell cycle response regulator
MKTVNPTLIDRLSEIVDEIHLEEVKSIINTLTKINSFKHLIENDLCEENLYNQISSQLKNEFEIETLKISLYTKNEETILFEQGEKKNLGCKFTNKVSNDTELSIEYCCKKLNKYQKLTLNTYFKELVHLLYIQFVLTNFKRTTTTDPLTKLTNRISFNQEMKTLIPLAKRENMNIGVLLINIDRFKAVNDEHGDHFGDKFLKTYATKLKNTVRSSDLVVRFGGDEFLILLINVDTPQRVIDIAIKIKNELSQTALLSPNGDHFKKTVCIGTSMFPKDGNDIDTIIKNADIALTDAKSIGRDQVKNYTKGDENVIELF